MDCDDGLDDGFLMGEPHDDAMEDMEPGTQHMTTACTFERDAPRLSCLELDPYVEKFDVSTFFPKVRPDVAPVLVNSVCMVNLDHAVDLKNLSLRCRNIEYNPRIRPTATLRMRDPKCTATVHASGKVSITGLRNALTARIAAKKVSKILRAVCGTSFDHVRFSVRSFISRVDLRTPIRLSDVAEAHPTLCMYEPELFCGLVVRLEGIRGLVFVTGKIIFTGAREMVVVYRAFQTLVKLLAPFALGAPNPYQSLTTCDSMSMGDVSCDQHSMMH
eukprot:PhM_4_TR18433/c0_g1_i1/m.28883/K03120/TBP, tbp; transcription initiation factor TFIID TATA-box-binding protein